MNKKLKKYILLILVCFTFGMSSVLAENAFSNYDIVSACGFDSMPAKVPEIISKIYGIAKILVPIILIVMGMVDLVQAIMSGDEKRQQKSTKKFITRIIAAIVVFLIMALVQFVFKQVDVSDQRSFSDCMNCILSNDCAAVESESNERCQDRSESNCASSKDKYGFTCELITPSTYNSKPSCKVACSNYNSSPQDCFTKTTYCTYKNNECVKKATSEKKQSGGSSNNKKTSDDLSNDSEEEQIASYAKKFVMHPYVSGGTTLCEDWYGKTGCGVDCSGFVYAVYSHFGYDANCIGRTTYTQSSNLNAQLYTAAVNLKKGDLLFFYSTTAPSHVGIYVGDGEYVHASGKKTGVKTSKVVDGNPTLWARVIGKCSKN